MSFLLGGIKEAWIEFYNLIVRDAAPTLKGGIIVGLIVIILLCIAFSIRTKSKEQTVNSWFLFWVAVIFVFILIFYIAELS